MGTVVGRITGIASSVGVGAKAVGTDGAKAGVTVIVGLGVRFALRVGVGFAVGFARFVGAGVGVSGMSS